MCFIGLHAVNPDRHVRRLRPVCPAAKRQDEGRGQPRRRPPHRLEVQKERRANRKTILINFLNKPGLSRAIENTEHTSFIEIYDLELA